eukprot:359654-Chlamydomonas_euryale.AAC.3
MRIRPSYGGASSQGFKGEGILQHGEVAAVTYPDIGQLTRTMFKIIPRIVNVEEWGKKAPLSTAEYRLLRNYNEKPVLSRPQHTFFSGPGYLEVDVDVHTYAYAARVALQSFVQRLGTAVWDIAFVIQGNGPDELPEQVLCTARMHRVPFTPLRPYTELLPKS